MDSQIDTNTGVILPVSTTAYGLLFHKDMFEDRGQTRIKHQEKRRKTPGIFDRAGRTFGKYPDFWKIPGLLESSVSRFYSSFHHLLMTLFLREIT
jgi:hypothetical protein